MMRDRTPEWGLLVQRLCMYVGVVYANKKDGIWKQSPLIEAETVLLVARDLDLLKVVKLATKAWPYAGRHPNMKDYPAWTKMTFVPFDETRQINPTFRSHPVYQKAEK